VTPAILKLTRHSALLLLAVAGLAFAQSARADMEVMLDQAKVIKLPRNATTVVIGNPAIVDVTIQKSGLAVLTGKTYGTTNMIMLDSANAQISEQQVVVKPSAEGIVTLQLGPDRVSLSCTPECEKTVKLGDGQATFDSVTGQVSARSGFATGQPNAPK
jgi:hypothetical protein